MHASLNHAYRLVWSALHNTWVAVAETAKARGKGGRHAMATLLLTSGLTFAGGALALDYDWNVTTGDWATGSNWLQGSAPSAGDSVNINNDGTAQVTSAATSSYLYVGETVTGTLTISNGGTVSNTAVGYLGYLAGSTGTATVDGAGSTWTNGSNLVVGHYGTGTLTISNGGAVSNTNGYIGNNAGSTGTVTVDGTGSSWTNGSNLLVGQYGTGTLNINNGGVVNSSSGYIGYFADGTGIVNVDGANSNWINSGILTVGRSGTGTLNINNGGAVSSASGLIGYLNGSTGIVNVDGANSNWINSGNLTIGNAVNSTATLNISNGGTVSGTAGFIGNNSGSAGTVTVDGSGSRWINSSGLFVGNLGSGTLNITHGGAVSNTNNAYIGFDSGSTGTVTVDGSGSSWINDNGLFIGNLGNGTLNITNGGAVSDTHGYIGEQSGSTGTVTVDGSGSSWINSGNMVVGEFGTGTFNITNGGAVSNTDGYIGLDFGSTGTVTVDGSGSSWSSGSSLIVGYSGNGTLNITNGSVVNVGNGTGNVAIALNTNSTGTLNIGAAQGSTAVAAGTLNAATVFFVSGTGALVFNHTSTDYNFTAGIDGAGAIGLYGGTTRFTGSLSSYTGTMTVDGGTLNIADGNTLQLGGHYTQTANGTLKVGASSATSYGKLDVTGQATFAAGTGLNVNVAGSNTLANGNTLTNVVSAGNLTASTFTVTDNSALFNFTASVTEGANGHIDLNTVAAGGTGSTPTAPTTVLSSVQHTGFGPGEGAARVLDTFVQGGTTGTDMDNVVTALGQLSTEQAVSNAVAQTLPLMNAGLSNVAVNTLHGTNRVIQARQDSNRGLSSGDDFFGNKKIWFKPVGSWAHQNNRNGVAGFNANTYGFVAGMDGELNEASRLGLAVSYMNSNVDGKSTSSGNRADIDAYQAIAYGSHTLASIADTEINWQADLGINKNNGRRAISFANRVAKSDYDSATAHAGVGLARHYAINDKTTIIPVIRADYTYIRDESYTEKGAGALNLKVKSHSTDELIVLAEGRLSHQLNDKATLMANAGLGYDLLDGKNSITASYVGGGKAFSTQGMDLSPWLGRTGLGLTVKATETTEVTARYDLEGRRDFVDQTASVKVRWTF